MLNWKHGLVLAAIGLSATAAATENVDWSLYGENYSNQRHSSLKQIHQGNIQDLSLAWKFNTGIKASFQASPIVVDGTMYLSTPFNHVVALDAETGAPLWRYEHELRVKKTCCGPANRGVAVAGDTVYQATIDGRLVALNRFDGRVLWDNAIKDVSLNLQETLAGLESDTQAQLGAAKVTGGTGHSFNMAPQVYGNKVFVGSTGAGYGLHLDTDSGLSVIGIGDGRTGLRGFLAAFDADTGEELWRWYSVPGEEWVGEWRTQTEDGVSLNRDIAEEKQQHKRFSHTWKLGGGSVWTTPAIDEETGWLFIGTGNPAPNMDDSTRPGDNLNTSSIVAIDSRTGELQWAYQQVPHDRWGYDVASPPVLFDLEVNGKTIKALGQAGKTGWFYILDRHSGELLFKSEAFVPQSNLFAQPTEEGVKIAPAIAGGSNWSPVAIDPNSQQAFISGIHLPAYYYRKKVAAKDSSPWESYSYFKFDFKSRYGTMTAIDMNNGQINWQYKTKLPLLGGALHTAGRLVFFGEGDGTFMALDSQTGTKLWSFKSDYGVNAPAISYQVKGKQYIAVAAGGNKVAGYPVGDELLVFALPSQN